MSKRKILRFLAAAGLCASGLAAMAQSPSGLITKPITLIVPYAPGGSSDTRARQLASKMSVTLGQPIVVENRPGAAGNIGTAYIAKGAPDGSVIGIGNFAPLAVNKWLFASMPFDPVKDVTPVALIEKGPLVLVVSADKSPAKSVADLVALGKSKPQGLTYASAGTGGSFHLAGELFEDVTRVKMLHVPYKGGGPATTDLLAGTVDFMFDMVPASLPFINGGKARALAIATDKRLPQLPNVPTFAELGYKGMEMSNWFGIIAPKNTPAPVVAKLNDAVNRALKDPEIAERITSQGNVIGGGTPQAFAAFIASESERWGKVIRDKHIHAE